MAGKGSSGTVPPFLSSMTPPVDSTAYPTFPEGYRPWDRPLQGHKVSGMSGLEPRTSWFRVEHSAATPQDPTTDFVASKSHPGHQQTSSQQGVWDISADNWAIHHLQVRQGQPWRSGNTGDGAGREGDGGVPQMMDGGRVCLICQQSELAGKPKWRIAKAGRLQGRAGPTDVQIGTKQPRKIDDSSSLASHAWRVTVRTASLVFVLGRSIERERMSNDLRTSCDGPSSGGDFTGSWEGSRSDEHESPMAGRVRRHLSQTPETLQQQLLLNSHPRKISSTDAGSTKHQGISTRWVVSAISGNRRKNLLRRRDNRCGFSGSSADLMDEWTPRQLMETDGLT
ncbi:hypothetical protein Bbelb_203640 [Branchiostoma belcheri]|nr:hypothetical protein Bbelb_203640 [Branchiostoma belcheri]